MRFRKSICSTLILALALCKSESLASAQSPSNISGTACGIAVANGLAPMSAIGYYFLITSNSGTSYQLFNINGSANQNGSYNYAANGSQAELDLSNSLGDTFNTSLNFNDVNYGTYETTNQISGGEQNGNFILFSGHSPATIAGTTFSFSVNDGVTPFAAAGNARVQFAVTGNTYQLTGDGVNVLNSTGTYNYNRLNAATGKIILNDSIAGNSTVIIAFTDVRTGNFGIKQSAANGFQVGDFQIANSIPPALALTFPQNKQSISNELVNVTGIATDNFGVADVLYSLNGSDWTEATPANNQDWSHWNAPVILNPGTNLLKVYAIDFDGNYSPTNVATFTYVVSDWLNLKTTGLGKLVPNYTNALLQHGLKYTVRAIPAPGFVLSNWTDNANNLVTNNPTLTFTLTAGLKYTAHFIDATKPVINLITPANNQRFSNANLTVFGKALDNAAVAGVFCSLNNSDWIAVTNTSNNWTNWNLPLQLTPGTNTLRTYAIDNSGNFSITNLVNFIYVLSAPLNLSITGRGKITPFANGAILPINQRFSMSAKPSLGFAFTNWSDAFGNPVTNQATLNFVMVSNLALTANFVDITKPTLTISGNPLEITTTSEFLAISGRASDNVGVTNVFFNFNNQNWNPATIENSGSNWTTTLDLLPGTNFLSACAVDAAGNYSAIKTIRIIYFIAPASLNNSIVQSANDVAQPFEYVFGARNFSQISDQTNWPNGVGIYNYTRLSPTTGKLHFSYVAPPRATHLPAQDLNLTFINTTNAFFTSSNTQMSGTVFLSPTTTLCGTSLVNQTVIYVSRQGIGQSVSFTSGKFATTDLVSGATNLGFTTSFGRYSPLNYYLKLTNAAGTTYTVTRYLSANYGLAYFENYAANGSYLGSDISFFGLASSAPSGNVPANLLNQNLHTFSGNNTFDLAFSLTTFSQQSFSPDFANGVGNYDFTLTDPNHAQLTLNYTATPDLVSQNNSTLLNFFAPNLAWFINPDNSVGASILQNLTSQSAATASPNSIIITNVSNGQMNQFQFSNDGTYALTGSLAATGNYTFSPYSPLANLMQLTFDNGNFSGDSGWLQLNYNSANGGNYQFSISDSSHNLLYTETGIFGQP